MTAVHTWIAESVWVAWGVLVVAFIVLSKSAGLFVDSSVSLANRFRIPKLVIGIVLVSLATTMPELSVSALSAWRGMPEMALGNAVGSVICNTGLGLALCAVFSAVPVAVIPHVLKASGGFLLAVSSLAFLFTLPDQTLSRWEGVVLVALFAGYLGYLFRQHKLGRYHDDIDLDAAADHLHMSAARVVGLFALGLGGILVSSDFVIASATTIARSFHIPEGAIALTLVAFGTSVPELATCITAARKQEGALAVGNIIGANIMNICWVAGFSSIVNSLTLSAKELFFMFPAMLAVLIVALVLLRSGYRLTRAQGFVLLAAYAVYLASFLVLFPAT